MSLNRRLWVWLLGPEQPESIASPLHTGTEFNLYFSQNGLESLCQGLTEKILVPKADSAEVARPYRILLSLMDRWEVGGAIIPRLFFPAMQAAQKYENVATPDKYAEVLRSAAQFFDGVEPGLIWSELLEMLLTALGSTRYPLLDSDACSERITVARYVLKTFNVQEEEMVIIYAPLVLLAIIVEAKDATNIPARTNQIIWEIASDLIDLIPERAFTSTMVKDECSAEINAESILTQVTHFFSLDSKKRTAFPPFSTKLGGHLILHQFAQLTAESLKDNESNAYSTCKFLAKVLRKVSFDRTFDPRDLLASIEKILNRSGASFESVAGAADVLAILIEKGYTSSIKIKHLIIPFVRIFWSELSPDTPRHHVEATRSLWNLQNALRDHRIEAAVCTLMVGSNIQSSAEPGRRFAVLWNHSSGIADYQMILSRPLFLLLDALGNDNEELSVHTRGWLQNLTSIDR